MPVRPMIYGSGKEEEAQAEVTGEPQPQPAPSPLTVLNEILMAPINLATTLAGAALPNEKEIRARYTRAYLPQGGVAPKMTTEELKSKNIFGAGGGY